MNKQVFFEVFMLVVLCSLIVSTVMSIIDEWNASPQMKESIPSKSLTLADLVREEKERMRLESELEEKIKQQKAEEEKLHELLIEQEVQRRIEAFRHSVDTDPVLRELKDSEVVWEESVLSDYLHEGMELWEVEKLLGTKGIRKATVTTPDDKQLIKYHWSLSDGFFLDAEFLNDSLIKWLIYEREETP